MFSKDANNPAWQYVLRSLEVAKNHVQPFNLRFNGSSCYVVNRFALGAIMATRNEHMQLLHFPLLPGDTPASATLALADHYVHMRAAMSETRDGIRGAWANRELFQWLRTYGYDGVKYGIKFGKEVTEWIDPGAKGPFGWMDYKLRENKRMPLSEPGHEPREWALKGMDDGTEDLRVNPSTPQNPPWFRAELKRVCNVEL